MSDIEQDLHNMSFVEKPEASVYITGLCYEFHTQYAGEK